MPRRIEISSLSPARMQLPPRKWMRPSIAHWRALRRGRMAFLRKLPMTSRPTGNLPVLANMTEFGETPLFTLDELRKAGVRMVLYPLSAFRAMNKAAETDYGAIRRDGHQKNVIAL